MKYCDDCGQPERECHCPDPRTLGPVGSRIFRAGMAAGEFDAQIAALALVRELGIEGWQLVPLDRWEQAVTRAESRAATTCVTAEGRRDRYLVPVAEPTPQPAPEPIDLAVEALREILQTATSGDLMPDDEARQDVEQRAHAALVALGLAEPVKARETLPTEPGAVVLAREAYGRTFDPPIPLMLRDIPEKWISPVHMSDGLYVHQASGITDWQHADVVPRHLTEDLRGFLYGVEQTKGLTAIEGAGELLDRLRAATGGAS